MQALHLIWAVDKGAQFLFGKYIHSLEFFYFSDWWSKSPIKVYSSCPQTHIYFPAALLSIPYYKINLYLSKRGIFIS